MLESEGLQTRSLQKIQMPGDNKPTPVFIDTAPAQRNPTTTDNKQYSGQRTSLLQSSNNMSIQF